MTYEDYTSNDSSWLAIILIWLPRTIELCHWTMIATKFQTQPTDWHNKTRVAFAQGKRSGRHNRRDALLLKPPNRSSRVLFYDGVANLRVLHLAEKPLHWDWTTFVIIIKIERPIFTAFYLFSFLYSPLSLSNFLPASISIMFFLDNFVLLLFIIIIETEHNVHYASQFCFFRSPFIHDMWKKSKNWCI